MPQLYSNKIRGLRVVALFHSCPALTALGVCPNRHTVAFLFKLFDIGNPPKKTGLTEKYPNPYGVTKRQFFVKGLATPYKPDMTEKRTSLNESLRAFQTTVAKMRRCEKNIAHPL